MLYKVKNYGFSVDIKKDFKTKNMDNYICFKLVTKSSRLTNKELRFMRDFIKFTRQKFAKRFNTTLKSVQRWEIQQNPGLSWEKEKDIRLEVFKHIPMKNYTTLKSRTPAEAFLEVFNSLQTEPTKE